MPKPAQNPTQMSGMVSANRIVIVILQTLTIKSVVSVITVQPVTRMAALLSLALLLFQS